MSFVYFVVLQLPLKSAAAQKMLWRVWANNVRRSKTFPSAILKFERIVSLSALLSATARTLRILVPPGKTATSGRWRTMTDYTRRTHGRHLRQRAEIAVDPRHALAANGGMFARQAPALGVTSLCRHHGYLRFQCGTSRRHGLASSVWAARPSRRRQVRMCGAETSSSGRRSAARAECRARPARRSALP